MVFSRPARLLAACTMATFIWLLFYIARSPTSFDVPDTKIDHLGFKEPSLELIDEPPEPLHRVSGNNYAPDNLMSDRIPATLLSLVRNSELDQLVQSMQELERTFNSKFNYPWTFFNDEPFTETFKKTVRAETKAQVNFEIIPSEHWQTPPWINQHLYQESAAMLKENDVQYADLISYHQMCRWNSGMFQHHPALKNTQYYWRVEPNVHFFCEIDYDVFRFMHDHNKTYGFTINLYDSPQTMPSLWPETERFIADADNRKFLHPHSARAWVEDAVHRPEHNKKANGYSTCHFWSNFEIGALDFWRSPAYTSYFDHLDRSGGFFYERWGDAPVHSIALGLFEDRDRIHWFRDIGYNHIPFQNCPNRKNGKCKGCKPGTVYDGEPWLLNDDCRPSWISHVGLGEWVRAQ